jgi:HK97 family phage prohead protease
MAAAAAAKGSANSGKDFTVTAIRKFFSGAVVADRTLSDRQVRVIASTPTPDRDGDILAPSGCVLTNYNRNPIVLAGHDPAQPVGNARVSVLPDRVEAVITFAPAGASPIADHWAALAKSGVVRAVSVGFRPIEWEPLGRGGRRYTSWELMEISLVSVPANADALVVERSYRSRKSGRVLSAANAAALGQALDLLGKSECAHERALGLLDKADRHRAAASRIGSALLANAEPDDDDGAADSELAGEVARRKRIAEAQALVARSRGPEEAAADRRRREADALLLSLRL